jgi:ankyrin repeat protein
VDCLFHAIRSRLTVKMLRTALQSLPQSLVETYDKMLSAIKPEYQDFAQRTLTLLCFSARPIQVCELIEALAVKVGTESGHYDPEEKLSTAHDLLSICPGMLNVKGPAEDKYDVPSSEKGQGFSQKDWSRRFFHADRRIVGLAHFSVREYLVSDRVLNSFPKYRLHPDVSHGWIARLCLVYLIYLGLDYSLLPRTYVPGGLWYYGTFDFFDYALSEWSTHARKNGNQSSLFSLVKAIGASHSVALALFSIKDRFEASNTLYSRFPLRPQESQVIIVKWLSYHGMADLLDMVLAAAQELLPPQRSIFGLPPTDGEYVTLDGSLLGSSRSKASSSRTLQKLDRNNDLRKEASVNLAIRQSHWNVVHRLLSKGFRADTKHNVLALDPLQIAARNGQHEAVSLMLKPRKDFGVYYTREASDLKHPMLFAAANGHSTTVATLLRARIGAKGLKGPHGVTPLILASQRGHVEVVKVLLKQGLDHQKYYGMTALMGAAQRGHLDVVKILVENGARWIDLADVDGNNALGYAVKNNHLHIVDFLSTQGVPRNNPSQPPSKMNLTESCGKYETSRAAINLPWKSRIIETDDMSVAFAGTSLPEDVSWRYEPDSDDLDSDDAAVPVVKVDHGEPIASMSGAVDVMDLDIDDADVRIAKFDDAVR